MCPLLRSQTKASKKKSFNFLLSSLERCHNRNISQLDVFSTDFFRLTPFPIKICLLACLLNVCIVLCCLNFLFNRFWLQSKGKQRKGTRMENKDVGMFCDSQISFNNMFRVVKCQPSLVSTTKKTLSRDKPFFVINLVCDAQLLVSLSTGDGKLIKKRKFSHHYQTLIQVQE